MDWTAMLAGALIALTLLGAPWICVRISAGRRARRACAIPAE